MAVAVKEVHEGLFSADESEGEDQRQLQKHQPQQQEEQQEQGHEGQQEQASQQQQQQEGEHLKAIKLCPAMKPWETPEGLIQRLKEVVLVVGDLVAILTEL